MSREEDNLPLFETKVAEARAAYKGFALTVFLSICLIYWYRITQIPSAEESNAKWLWIGMFMAELWFGFYWFLTQSLRWKNARSHTFKDRLSQRYGDKLPSVDIFVCTADPKMEPPTLVINTVLSLMSYNYPTEKLSIYLSDDGGSEVTFYAFLEASKFSKKWIPFCKKFKVEPRSPEAYFSMNPEFRDLKFSQEWSSLKKLYADMNMRIEAVMEKGEVPKEIKDQHRGFSEWNHTTTKQNHQSIVQILFDGRNPNMVDADGNQLPTMVYLAREKRPNWPHNFKAGAMNALMRVSSEISNAPFILNVDCDMFSNDSNGILDALCFFLDEEHGRDIAFVQHPQNYSNVTKNDLYSSANTVVTRVELAALGGYGTAMYCGTGCFHRRESLYGSKPCEGLNGGMNTGAWKGRDRDRTVDELESTAKVLASCSYEKGTQWGKEMGLLYECVVEDVITGLAIQCRGWRSVVYNPDRRAFLGVVPTTLDQSLVQFKRWSQGLFQIFLSKYCPFIHGHRRIPWGAQMAYSNYLLWAPVSVPTLYYVIVPPLSLLRGIPLFPKVSSIWFLPFACVFIPRGASSLVEFLYCGGTLKAWWNAQRMWVYRRTTSFALALVDTILRLLGLSQTAFALTTKVVDEDALRRYEQEIMEFGSSSIMFTIIATLSLVNLFSLVWAIKKAILNHNLKAAEDFMAQFILCGLMVLLNIPVYQALFFRADKGSLPSSVMLKSIFAASVTCLLAIIY